MPLDDGSLDFIIIGVKSHPIRRRPSLLLGADYWARAGADGQGQQQRDAQLAVMRNN